MSTNDERRITRAKFKDGKIRIEWEQRTDDKQPWGEYSIHLADLPAPEFPEAVKALRGHVARVCGFSPEYVENMEIIGFSLSWSHDIMGGCCTAIKPLVASNSPLVINTPHQPEEPYSDGGDDSVCMSGDSSAEFRRAAEEALAYVDGKRAQMDIEHFVKDWDRDLKAKGVTMSMTTATGETASIGAKA